MTLTDPTAAAKKAPKPRGAKVLLVVGLVLLVIGVAGGQWGIHRLTGAFREIRNSGDDVRNSLLLEVEVPGTGEVELDPGRYDIFAIRPQAPGFSPTTTTSTTAPPLSDDPTREDPYPGYEEPVVEVTGPDGRSVALRAPGIESTFVAATGELFAIHTFRVARAGNYRVEAFGTGADKVGVGPTVDNDDVGRLARGGILGILGYLGAAIGFVLALVGLIWLLVAGGSQPPPPPMAYRPGALGPWPPSGPWGGPPGAAGPPAWGPPPGAWPPGSRPAGWVPPAAPPPPPPPPAAPQPAPGTTGPPMTPPGSSPWSDRPPDR